MKRPSMVLVGRERPREPPPEIEKAGSNSVIRCAEGGAEHSIVSRQEITPGEVSPEDMLGRRLADDNVDGATIDGDQDAS